MELKEILDNNAAALVEYYDDSAASAAPDRIVEEVKKILGPEAPVYRINVGSDERERSLVRLDSVPAIIIYRNHREEWRITSDWPDARTLAERLEASLHAAGAVSPLKGRHRSVGA